MKHAALIISGLYLFNYTGATHFACTWLWGIVKPAAIYTVMTYQEKDKQQHSHKITNTVYLGNGANKTASSNRLDPSQEMGVFISLKEFISCIEMLSSSFADEEIKENAFSRLITKVCSPNLSIPNGTGGVMLIDNYADEIWKKKRIVQFLDYESNLTQLQDYPIDQTSIQVPLTKKENQKTYQDIYYTHLATYLIHKIEVLKRPNEIIADQKIQYQEWRRLAQTELSEGKYTLAKKHFEKALTLAPAEAKTELLAQIERCDNANVNLLVNRSKDLAEAKDLYNKKQYLKSYQLLSQYMQRDLIEDSEAYYILGRMLYYNYKNLCKDIGISTKEGRKRGEYFITVAARMDHTQKKFDSKAINLFYQMLEK